LESVVFFSQLYYHVSAVARKWLGKHSHSNEYTHNRRIVGHVFYALHAISKDSRQIVFPRTSVVLWHQFSIIFHSQTTTINANHQLYVQEKLVTKEADVPY
jgi:hypothetical protein